MSVQRSLKHISVQLIDDLAGKTLVSASSKDKALRDQIAYGGNCESAAAVGKAIAEKALEAGIKAVRLDRGHSRYHGRVAALAEAAREAGLVL
jgi:large subunit ribosomal protein L18